MAQIFRAGKSSKQRSKQAETIELTIDSLDHQGRGVCRHQGKVGFVDGALASERIKARISTQKSRIFEAYTTKVLEPSVERTTPFCQYYQQCGGCSLQHLDASAQLVHKQQAVSALFDKFAKATELPWLPPLAGPERHYRRAGRIACIYDKQNNLVRLGFRAAGSKKIIEIDHCAVMVDTFAGGFEALRQSLNAHPELRSVSHIQFCAADNGAFVLLRHTRSISIQVKAQFAERLAAQNWEFVWDDGKSQPEYASLPAYESAGVTFEFKLDNFIQVNRDINEQMLHRALDWLELTGDEQVLDLFCGIGNFSLLLAKHANKVVAVEGVAASVAMARQNAHTNHIDTVSFHQFDLTQPLTEANWFHSSLDVLVLDPSRTGAYEVLRQLPLTQFKRVLYVSCDPVTMARDAALLLEAGFVVDKVCLMNMFPHTGHIETMALFQRR
ncbi:23S rRNA (uracil(1939)-C(5))-methyltransferase RlmD [Pseudoalteromonas sp. R3]|uniref:23S rRNA (uracil(1939)-C(5))-methyltransferase RlmD n=1 Tax=Pseudoalteromonas sp. R3 TaxID=1709477 RepID=UPI0006B4CCA7|nr:23S rRNA (uracil(1939)-C(5))-methyltransferase RlmD [Pseudoalteromonas sp. R3]AZZ97355.1 23S rRNA (uracil(1939)-C(5))-methyltransferase RlmD [Pseudoalteromonas sp. R3]